MRPLTTLPRGLSAVRSGDCRRLLGSPQPPVEQSLDLPGFPLRCFGRTDLAGRQDAVCSPADSWAWGGQAAPGQGPLTGRHCCSQQLGEISAAVGCQLCGWEAGEGREGGHQGRGVSEPGGALPRSCSHSPLLPPVDRAEKMKHGIPLKRNVSPSIKTL